MNVGLQGFCKRAWSWNDALDAEELHKQVSEFAEKGSGGYFTHARVALVTPFSLPNGCTVSERGQRKAGKQDWNRGFTMKIGGQAGMLAALFWKSDEYRSRFVRMRGITAQEVSEALEDPKAADSNHLQFAQKQYDSLVS